MVKKKKSLVNISHGDDSVYENESSMGRGRTMARTSKAIPSALQTSIGWYPAGPHISHRSSSTASTTSIGPTDPWRNGSLLSELLAALMIDDKQLVKEVQLVSTKERIES
jgi:hypothetical protein